MVTLRSSVIHLVAIMDIKEMVYDHSYVLTAITMAWKTMKALDWAAIFRFPAAQWLPCSFARGYVSLLPAAGRVRVIVQRD